MIEFRDPPKISHRGRAATKFLEEFVKTVRQRPNEWAVYRTGLTGGNSSTTASSLRKRHPDIEWVRAKEEDGTFAVFARYVATWPAVVVVEREDNEPF
jgi:DNA-binding NarL/FixJ family response regulator